MSAILHVCNFVYIWTYMSNCIVNKPSKTCQAIGWKIVALAFKFINKNVRYFRQSAL